MLHFCHLLRIFFSFYIFVIQLFETWKTQKDAMIKRELHRKKAETKMADEEKKQKKIKEQKERESAHKSW